MEGGGGYPNFLKLFFNSKIFLGKFFFEFKKLIKNFEKFSPNFIIETHLVPVAPYEPDTPWKKIVKNG
jgi:hypothetical protein